MRLLAVSVLAALALVGCGSESNDEAGSTIPPPPTVSAPTVTATPPPPPCSTSGLRLTLPELHAFFEEFIALLNRYKRPGADAPPGARTVLTRLFAFPAPTASR